MVLSGEPCGKIDYQGGKIYGKDLGYGMFAEPIAYLESKNGVTQIMDAKKGLFSSPMLYIQDDKVYTPEQWTSLAGTVKQGMPFLGCVEFDHSKCCTSSLEQRLVRAGTESTAGEKRYVCLAGRYRNDSSEPDSSPTVFLYRDPGRLPKGPDASC